MKLEIISPEKVHFEGEVTSVSLPGSYGAFTVLKNHAPIISSLAKGSVSYVSKDEKVHHLKIEGGFVEVKANVVSVCIEKFNEE